MGIFAAELVGLNKFCACNQTACDVTFAIEQIEEIIVETSKSLPSSYSLL